MSFIRYESISNDEGGISVVKYGGRQMTIDNSYYEDEVREGFYIPGMTKRSWAVQMDVLDHVREICEKHDIKWFADCGTLLGAVRHHGFIPWDDDLDICMLKEDYDKFLSVVDDELPQGYRVLNIYKEKEYTNFITRIVNHSEINISEEFLNDNHGFPYIAGIDIFPLHYMYDNDSDEADRLQRAKRLWELTQNYIDGRISDRNLGEISREVEKNSKKRLRKDVPLLNALYLAIDEVFSEADFVGTKYVSLMPVYIEYPDHKFPVSLFNTGIDMRFEDRTIRIPAKYEDVLEIEYGKNWGVANLKGGLHDYPCYSEQEKDLEEHFYGRLPYKYYPERIPNDKKDIRDSNKQIIETLYNAHEVIRKILGYGVRENIIEVLENCQTLAIKLGTNLEKSFDSESSEVVSELETYCEELYQISMNISEQEEDVSVESLDERIRKVQDLYQKLKHNDTIFIVNKGEDWDILESIYKDCILQNMDSVYVMPIPYYEKDWSGKLTNERLDTSWIPSEINVLNYRNYDFYAGVSNIVFADPFDEYENGISVNPFFYSSNLKKYADKLTYVHTFRTRVFKESEKARVNAKHYVLSPGVLNADCIIVPNEEERELYIDLLNENGFGTEETREKIRVRDYRNKQNRDKKRKKLLFYTGFSELYSKNSIALGKIERVLKVFETQKNNLEVVWVADADLEKNITDLCNELLPMYNKCKETFSNSKTGRYVTTDDTDILDEVDAYYGTRGFFMNRCVVDNKPVMKWNTEI